MRAWVGLGIVFLSAAGVLAAAPAATERTAGKPASAKARPTSIRGVHVVSRDPYVGLIALDDATGKALIEEQADSTVYPASIIKLMSLFVIMDRIQQGSVHPTDPVTVTAEMAKLGASQVYLKEKEVFTVEDLIYALMVKSANDAAAALAIQVAGSQPAFVELMNQKAQVLGMTHTRFYSCHGLPPTAPLKPGEVDVSTPRELAILGRALVKAHPEVLQYTSTRQRVFRPGPKQIDMVNHNHRLMSSCPGVDGLKTGYFEAAGYSTLVTAKRNGRRVFVVVAGCGQTDFGKARDKTAAECLNRAFTMLPPLPAPTNVVAAAVAPPSAPVSSAATGKQSGSNWRTAAIVAGVLVTGALAAAAYLAWRRRSEGILTAGSDDAHARRPGPTLTR